MTDDATDRCHEGDCSTGAMCFKHRIRTIQVAPSATPSRRNNVPSQVINHNSWEAGIARDERGMPLLNSKGDPIGMKEMQNRRHEIETRVRELKNTPPTPTNSSTS